MMEIIAKKCWILIHKHIAHTFFKLGVEQWWNNKNYVGLPISSLHFTQNMKSICEK